MNLPFIKKFRKEVLPSYFLVLVLREEKAQAVIFEENDGKIKIVGFKEEYFSTSVDEASQKEFLEKLDKAISQAESTLPENIQTQKTIFGVKESWTENDQIKKGYLAKLKRASEELGLTPIGFLVISQAISHLLQKEEGAPVSAILVEVNGKTITVTLLRAGKSIETKSSEIHDSIPFTVDTLLKHFNIPEILPSRIIIFNGKEDLSQEFISHTWSKSLPFLHLPQITNLPEGFDARSVLFGAATQMRFEISENNVITGGIQGQTENAEKVGFVSSANNSVHSATEDFGFAKDVDVAKIAFQPARNASQSDAGGEPVEDTEMKAKTIPQFNTEKMLTETKHPKGFGDILKFIRNILFTILGLIFTIAKKINIKKILPLATSGKLSSIVPAILILAVAVIAGYFLFIKATIAITVDPKILEQNKSVLFSTTKTTNPSKNIIKGEFVSVSEDGSVSTPATGKKDVGTNAKGTVTIFNLSDKSVTLPNGTKIVSTNGLEFVLGNSLNLASASSSLDPITLTKTTKPFTTSVDVTANQLGKEYNLPSGTKFNVNSFETTDLIAKNDNPFSGGTKKQVTVASKNDSTKLEGNLLKQLEDKAKEDLGKQLDKNKILLPMFITETLGKKSLNAKIGDEINQLTLTGTVEYRGISYDKNGLITFSKFLLSKDVPSNQEIDYNNIKTAVLDIKQENDEEIEANLNVKALLLPKIDETKLTKDLKGKSFKTAEDVLYKLPQIANVIIKLSPNLPFLPKNLPAREKNIKILINIDG